MVEGYRRGDTRSAGHDVSLIKFPRKKPHPLILSRAVAICVLAFAVAPSLRAQMDPFFTAINYPARKDSVMIMPLLDFQTARSGPNFFTEMGMVEYGVTSRWTVDYMAEGQKIFGLPATFGGQRFGTYFRLFPRDHLLNFTLYAEYEYLNRASLYKMEVSGFGGEDLVGSLSVARRSAAHTLEERAIMYHDWGRVNLTFNFISETGFENHENDFGYASGIFRQPKWMGTSMEKGAMGMPGMRAPSRLSFERLGYGLEMVGALGNDHHFGFVWHAEQQYLGPVFTYALSPRWSVRVEPAFGLSHVSDPVVLRLGAMYSIDHVASRLARVF